VDISATSEQADPGVPAGNISELICDGKLNGTGPVKSRTSAFAHYG
jgi:hypothetical protein